MLSKIGSALQAAADVVAPPCAKVEDLRYHWSQVVNTCQRCQGPNPYNNVDLQSNAISEADNNKDVTSKESSGNKIRASMVPAVEETHAPRHLAQMLKIILGEEGEGFVSLGPCLEFLVTEKVLTSLASFAWCDRPLGIRQHSYVFLTGVLNHLHHTHLHHARIHKPLQSMVRASCDMTASPYEVQEIDFLNTLCEKIRQDHSLVLLYIQPAVLSEDVDAQRSTHSECSTPVLDYLYPQSNDSSISSEPQTQRTSAVDGSAIPVTEENKEASHSQQSKSSHHRTPSESSLPSSGLLTLCSSASSSRLSLSSTASSFVNVTRRTSEQLCRPQGVQSSFPLVDALLNLSGSADCTVSRAAHDALLLLCGVREPICSKTIARHTLFPQYLATRVAECIAKVPKDIEPVLVEDLVVPKEKPKTYSETAAAAALSSDISSSDSEDADSNATEDAEEDFQGRRQLLMMLQWLSYCDKVVCAGESVLNASLCNCLREIVLDGEVRTGLHSDSEETVGFTLALVIRIITALSSHSLIMCVVWWLCGDSPSETLSSSSSQTPVDQANEGGLLPLIMSLCKEPSSYQVTALRLVQTAIQCSCGGAAAVLTGPWLSRRQYYDSSGAEVQQNCWSDEEDERAKQKEDTSAADSPGTHPISRTFAPNNINRIVKQFLCVVPDELRSSGADDFASYKNDAVRQYREVTRTSGLQHWAREAYIVDPSVSSSVSSRDSPPEGESNHKFTSGPFLEMLMDLLERLPEQNYDINLQVTSVISTLALLPQPHLHELLLNPSLPMVGNVRTPYTVLRGIVATLSRAVLSTPDYKQHLKLSRHQLLGDLNSWQMERDDVDRQFEAVIVIEEFCKELASIAHAKYTVEVDR